VIKTVARMVLLFFAIFVGFVMIFAPGALNSRADAEAYAEYVRAPSEATKASLQRQTEKLRSRIVKFEAVCGVVLIGTICAFWKMGSVSRRRSVGGVGEKI
jgi:hypothetical protein